MPPKRVRVRAKKHILRPAKKIGAFVLLLFQLARLAGVGFLVNVTITSLFSENEVPAIFNPGIDCNSLDQGNLTLNCTDNQTTTTPVPETTTTEDPDPLAAVSTQDWLMFCMPCVEILTSLCITSFVMGPLSPKVGVGRWFVWLFRMRIFWMRFVWTCTAIAYAFIYARFRQLQYAEEPIPENEDTVILYPVLFATALEYGCLGMLESVVTLVKVETIESRLIKSDKAMRGFWKTLYMVAYYLCLLAYAIRNFSMSLYFGILSVLASLEEGDGLTGELKIYHSLVQVLRIYLAIIRGKFYGLFMHKVLSHFLYEADDPYYQHDLKVENDPELNGAGSNTVDDTEWQSDSVDDALIKRKPAQTTV